MICDDVNCRRRHTKVLIICDTENYFCEEHAAIKLKSPLLKGRVKEKQ